MEILFNLSQLCDFEFKHVWVAANICIIQLLTRELQSQRISHRHRSAIHGLLCIVHWLIIFIWDRCKYLSSVVVLSWDKGAAVPVRRHKRAPWQQYGHFNFFLFYVSSSLFSPSEKKINTQVRPANSIQPLRALWGVCVCVCAYLSDVHVSVWRFPVTVHPDGGQ